MLYLPICGTINVLTIIILPKITVFGTRSGTANTTKKVSTAIIDTTTNNSTVLETVQSYSLPVGKTMQNTMTAAHASHAVLRVRSCPVFNALTQSDWQLSTVISQLFSLSYPLSPFPVALKSPHPTPVYADALSEDSGNS